jgi:CheY-like chemotaxis protein
MKSAHFGLLMVSPQGNAAIACGDEDYLLGTSNGFRRHKNSRATLGSIHECGSPAKFHREIPAIVMSVRSTHLDKPVEAVELLRVVTNLLAATAEKETKASGGQSPATIFVVDDDPGVRDAVREMLESHGWDVETFESCEAFLRALRSGHSGCLVIDAVLPGMDGFELLARLKADQIALPSIMITGHGEVSLAVKAMQAGGFRLHREAIRPRGACREYQARAGASSSLRARARAANGRRRPSRWFDDASTANSEPRACRPSQQEHRRGSGHQPANGGEPSRRNHAENRLAQHSRADPLGCHRGLRSVRAGGSGGYARLPPRGGASCGRGTLSRVRLYVRPAISTICFRR